MKSFSEIDGQTFTNNLFNKIKSEVEKKSKEYILGVDENEYKRYLVSEYTLEPLEILFDKEQKAKPTSTKESVYDHMYGRSYEREIYNMTITYPFLGSPALFSLRPQRWMMTSYEIKVNHNSTVSFSIRLLNLNVEEFNREKQSAIEKAFSNCENVNAFALYWNNQLGSIIDSIFDKQKEKFQKENDFFTAINIPINPDTQLVFTAPSIKKKDIPQPEVNKSKEFSSEPTMGNKMYEDILEVIYNLGKGMERKPSLYIGKDEEALRDVFLLMLEARYDAITATGETFNRSGKTDIILKYAKDGTNLFVAECKFWHGFKGFLETISQLFDRYLTWRDSKVAVIIFVKTSDFTSVLKNISTEIRTHPYYLKDTGHRGESSFSYIFHLKQDQKKQVQLEVMAFHFDK